MRKYLILFSLLAATSVFSIDWDQRFQEVCNIDKMCLRLKHSDGAWLKPKAEVIALLKDTDIQAQIKSSAKQYGVDPVAIAGAIAAENSLNVGVKDTAQTWLAAKMGITSIAGKSFSFGLGQITLPAARDAENHLAKIENREPKSDSELTKEIADPLGSIRIAATIIKKVQDDYAEKGFDISKDPGVLATLYNLGKSKEKAAQAKQSGSLPRANYFGLFVEKYSAEIKTAAKLEPPATSEVSIKSATPIIAQSPPVAPTLKSISGSTKAKESATVISAPLPILSAPLFCKGSEYGQAAAQELATTSYGAPVGVLLKGASYEALSKSLDCNSEIWTLISSNEKIGWIKEEELNKVTVKQLVEKRSCENKPSTQCSQNISSNIDKYDLKEPQGSLIFLKPVAPEKSESIGFEQERNDCQKETAHLGNQTAYGVGYPTNGGMMGHMNSQKKTKSNDELKKSSHEWEELISDELQRMSQSLGIPLDRLNDAENPYSSVAMGLSSLNFASSNCIKTSDWEHSNCPDLKPAVDAWKQNPLKINYQKFPSLKDVREAAVAFQKMLPNSLYSTNLGTSNYYPLESEVGDFSIADVRNSILECTKELQNIATAAPSILAIIENNISLMAEKNIEDNKRALIDFGRFCHARLNLIRPPKNSNPINCQKGTKIMSTGFHNFSRDFIAKVYKDDPQTMINDIIAKTALTPGLVNMTPTSATMSFPPFKPSYCPSKTAEFIEELIKNNPCIRRVYVPTEFLAKKLNTFGSKVIYRKFEKTDRYAIDVGDYSCK